MKPGVTVTVSADAAAQMSDRELRECVRHICRSFGRARVLAQVLVEAPDKVCRSDYKGE